MKSSAPTPITPGFRRLTLITVFFIFLLMVAGGTVRVTGSGLGCPDWPLCYGRVLPPPQVESWIEFTHRFIAGIGGIFILITTYIAWRRYSHITAVAMPTALIVSLLIVQVPLGAIVVASELEPVMVAVHLALALFIFAGSIVTAAGAHLHGKADLPQLPTRSVRTIFATGTALFVLLMSGALVVGYGASYGCPDWPLCNGQVIPVHDPTPAAWIQFAHRAIVATVSAFIIGTFFSVRRNTDRRDLRMWAAILLGLFFTQALIGAVQVLLILPAFWRIAHLAVGSATWGALVALGGLDLLRTPQTRRREETEPVTGLAPSTLK